MRWLARQAIWILLLPLALHGAFMWFGGGLAFGLETAEEAQRPVAFIAGLLVLMLAMPALAWARKSLRDFFLLVGLVALPLIGGASGDPLLPYRAFIDTMTGGHSETVVEAAAVDAADAMADDAMAEASADVPSADFAEPQPGLTPRSLTDAERAARGLPDQPEPEAAAGPPPQEEPAALDLREAELKFNRPDRMNVSRAYTVEAAITLPGGIAPQGLGDIGAVESRAVRIGQLARVELVGDAFEIEPLTRADNLVITRETPGLWSWRVRPRRAGEQRLVLQVYAIGPDGEALARTFAEVIPVDVTMGDRANLATQFVLRNWDLAASALGAVGGVFVFLFNLLRRRREKPAAEAA